MSNTTVRVKRGDVGRVFSDTLTTDGSAVNLSGATVRFVLRPRTGGTPQIDATATIVSAGSGTVSYTTTTGDLDTSGEYRQEWEVTFSGGTIGTWPDDGYNTVHVLPDLNPE